MQAIQLIKDEELAEYRINIEADSMAALDWAAERDAAVQFMQGLGAFVSQVAPLAQQMPSAAPVLMSLLQWSVSKFRVSTQIEAVLDQAITSMKQQAMQPPQPPQPTIDQQIELKKIETQAQIAAMESQTDKDIAALKGSIEMQKVELQAKMDQMQQQFENIRELLAMNPDSGTKLGQLLDNVHTMATGAINTQVQTQQQLAQVMEQLNKRKRRVPIRDANGDIVEVREVDDEMSPGNQAALTGGAPLPPAVTPQIAQQPSFPN
jgi:HPt (histidine-containing phosphotransfer) domain-containing protein